MASMRAPLLTSNEIYSQLEVPIGQLCHFNTIERPIWVQSFTLIYDYCSPSFAIGIKSKTGPDRTDSPINLFQHLESTLTNNLNTIRQDASGLNDRDLVQFYIDHSCKYRGSCKSLTYMYDYWIQRSSSPADLNQDFMCLATSVWENVLLKPLLQRMIEACINLSIGERTNPTDDHQLLASVIRIFNDQELSQKLNFEDVLPAVFEKQFVEHLETFHPNIPRPTIYRSLIDFLTGVKEILAKDEEIFRKFLSTSNVHRLKERLEKIYIGDHLDQISEQMKIFLREKNIQNLVLWGSVINQMSYTKAHVVKMAEECFYRMGMEAIELIQSQVTHNPIIYIENICHVYEVSSTLIKEAFNNDPDYLRALNEACQTFINTNSVTTTTSTTDKLLTRFCDKYLRRRNPASENDEGNQFLNRLMIVFNYMNDKDVFEKLYRKSLVKRLISRCSQSEDEEMTIVSKFKEQYGSLYTAKMERILQDTQLNRDFIKTFPKVHSLSVMVFTSNSWPFPEIARPPLSAELRVLCDSFTNFYSTHHQGRRLHWLTDYSTGELSMPCIARKYVLKVSTYQMLILLLFNQSLQWTVEQIREATQIDSELLIKILYSFFQNKLCTFSQSNDELNLEEKDITLSTSVHLADQYHNEMIQVNLDVPCKIIKGKKMMDRVDESIDQERKMVIQSTIIRILKSKQTMKYTELVHKVIGQVQSRFQPRTPMIELCIDILIEKEYLERDANDKHCLRYLA